MPPRGEEADQWGTVLGGMLTWLQGTKQILNSVTFNAPPMGSVSEELDRAGSVSIDNKSDDSTTILKVTGGAHR